MPDLFDTLTEDPKKKKKDLFDEIDQTPGAPTGDVFDHISPTVTPTENVPPGTNGTTPNGQKLYEPTSTAKEILRRLPGFAANFVAPTAANAKDVAAAAAYEAAGGVKGLSLGYVDPTSLVDKTPLANADINKKVAEGAGQFVGAMAPIAKLSQAVHAGMAATGVLNGVRPILSGLVQSGITGSIYGAARKPEEAGLAKRAQNALDDAATFILFTGVGQIVDQAAQALSLGKGNAYNSLREDIINSFVKKGAAPDQAQVMADAGLKAAVEHGGGWSEVKASDLRAARNAVRAGEKFVIGESPEPVNGQPQPETAAPKLLETKAQETTNPPAPVVPPQKGPAPQPELIPPHTGEPPKPQPLTTIDEKSVSIPGIKYLQSKFPALAQAVIGKQIPLSTEQMQEVLKQATAAGEDVLLKGGSPEQANIEAVKRFGEAAKPLVASAAEATKLEAPAQAQPDLFDQAAEVFAKQQVPIEHSPGYADVLKLQGVQPHELTPQQYGQAFGEGAPAGEIEQQHRELVKQAIKNGAQVPPEVLSAHPGLKVEANKELGRDAAQQILTKNKIDDQAVVNLVNHIVADNQAFKTGYGKEFNPEKHIILGETHTPIDRLSGDRLQTVISLANGAGPKAGRHEAFHAVSNILLDEGEQNVLLKVFGNHEAAADAFADYQAGKSTPASGLQAIFEKIKKFLERLKNYFQAKKFTTAEDIFEAVDRGEMAGRTKQPGGMTQYKAAYHGSPHEFDRFDISKVGSGEGNQAYGHGLYFSGTKKVAQHYRDKLSKYTYEFNGKPIVPEPYYLLPNTPEAYAVKALDHLTKPIEILREAAKGKMPQQFPDTETVKKAIKLLEEKAIKQGKGRLYEVDIPEDNEFLDHDKTIADQPDSVRSKLEKINKDLNLKLDPYETTGEAFYGALSSEFDFREVKNPALIKFVDKLGLPAASTDELASRYLASKGIPGIKYLDEMSRSEGKGTSNYVVFDDRAVTMVEKQYKAENRPEPAPTFYSQMQKTIDAKMPEKASPEQVKNIVSGQDVKKEEVEWSGIKEWLDEQEGSVTKQQVMDFLKQNQVQIQEVVKGGVNDIGNKYVGHLKAADALRRGERVVNQHGREMITTEEIALTSPNDKFIIKAPSTKFEKYTLPGGENYRELLLTLPPKAKSILPLTDDQIRQKAELSKNEWAEMGDAERADIRSEYLNYNPDEKPTVFTSSHFPEPNILSHVRFNERTDAEGNKILFLEEIQSDWHQKGRERGYQGQKQRWDTDSSQFRIEHINQNEPNPLIKVSDKNGKFITYYPDFGKKSEVEAMEQAKVDVLRNGPDPDQVPDAPFKKTWHELALKRMLRYAAENGYDKIAWTTGEQQAERYDLSKQLNDVTAEKSRDFGPDFYDITAKDKLGNKVINQTAKGTALPDLIGKDLAKKIIDSGGGTFKGLDLKVGAEGMKGFYDKIIPEFLNKYAKKWGGRVGETEISAIGGTPSKENFPEAIIKVPSLDITPSIKESVLSAGQPQYSMEEKIPEKPPVEGFNTPPGTKSLSKWQKFLSETYDRFQAIKYQEGKEIAKEYASAGGRYTRAYVMARELNGKIRGISEGLLKDLNESIKPLKNYAERLILNRIYSLRNYADLDRIGKTTNGVTAAAATDELNAIKKTLGDADFDRIAGVADKLADIQNNKALNILVDGKVISKQAADVLRERYPNYLRSEILHEKLGETFPDFKSADNGEPIGKINRSFLKTKEGTNKAINEDVLEVIRKSLVTKVAAAQKQIVIDQIAQDFGKQIGNTLFRDGNIVQEVDPRQIPSGYVKSSARASGGRVFAVSKDVADLLEGLNQKQADFITKAMSSYNRFFRAGATTLRAPFVFNNVFRDVQEALIKKRSIVGQRSQLTSYAEAAFRSFKEMLGISDHVFEAWQKAGGAYGGAVSSIMKGVDLPSKITPPREQLTRALKTVVTLPIEAVANLAEFSENTSRLAEWIRVSTTNMPEELKALQARDITVDFEKVGDMMKRINQLVPFLNANMQGTVNSIRIARDHPILALLRILTSIAVPTAILYQYNKKFKNDDLIDPYIKNSYWYLNTGSEATIGGKKLPVLVKIRKGELSQQLSYFFQGLLELANKDPNFKQKLDDFTAQGTIDSAVSSIVPPLIRVPIEEAANRNFFTGRPIVTQSIEDVSSGHQFKPGTTDTARRIGELTGVSPARFEHVATGLFPASGQAFEVADRLLKPNPDVKREDKSLFPFQSFVPVIGTPSGFFSQEEDAAQRFERENKVKTRTANFLYENAYRQYIQNPTVRNQAILNKAEDELKSNDARRIRKKVGEQEKINELDPVERALKKLPKKLRNKFADENP